jgi:hypothetical protein
LLLLLVSLVGSSVVAVVSSCCVHIGCEKLQLVSVSFKMLALCILAIIVYVSVATCGVGSFGIAS